MINGFLIHKFRPLQALALMGTMAIIAAGPSMASTTFAQYSQTDGAQQQWSISEATVGSITTTTVSATGDVQFTFSGVTGLPFSGPQDATFSLNAMSTQIGNCGTACATNDSYTQPGYSGTFSFTDVALGTNLLSGTFATTASPATTGAQLGSTIGGHGGSFDASDDGGNLTQIVLTSTYLSFADVTSETSSWSLSSLETSLGAGFAVGTVTSGQAYPNGTYGAAGTGTFSTTPGPPALAPEPASFVLIGGGLLGLGILRRRKLVRP